MALTGAGAADEHGVALLGEKRAAGEFADQPLVDRRAGEVEVVYKIGHSREQVSLLLPCILAPREDTGRRQPPTGAGI